MGQGSNWTIWAHHSSIGRPKRTAQFLFQVAIRRSHQLPCATRKIQTKCNMQTVIISAAIQQAYAATVKNLRQYTTVHVSLQKIWKSYSIPISTKIRLMKTLTSVACCESWTLRENKETRLDAFKMKGLRKILRVSWTAKKTKME